MSSTATPLTINKNAYWRGLSIGLLGAALFSCKAIVVKLAYGHGADAVSLIALRMLFAMPVFALGAWYIESKLRKEMAKPGSDTQSPWQPNDWWRLILLGGVGYYASSFLDFLGLQYISAGLERVILYLTPTIVLLIAVFWLKKEIGQREMIALTISYCGVMFVFWNDLSLSGKSVPLGAGLVFASAICYAIYLTSCGEMVKRLGALRLTAWVSLVSTAFCLVQALVLNPAGLFNQATQVYQLSVINGIFCTVLPVFFTMVCIERVGSTAASQTGMVGPVATIFLASFFLSEPITTTQLIGTAIVITGIFVLSMKKQ
jgi:drug/metabolite transporter (DMT)-like permease